MSSIDSSGNGSSTVIGRATSVRAHLKSEEDVLIQGRVFGRIDNSADLYIDEGAVVEAAVSALNLDVRGTVRGDVNVSDLVTVHPGGRIEGNVLCPRLVLTDGGTIQGKIDTDVQRQEVIDAILTSLSSPSGGVLELGGAPKWGGSSAGLLDHVQPEWARAKQRKASPFAKSR